MDFDIGPGDFDPSGFDTGPGDFDSGFESTPEFDTNFGEEPGMDNLDVFEDTPSIEDTPTDLNVYDIPGEIPEIEPAWSSDVPAIEIPPSETTAVDIEPTPFNEAIEYQPDSAIPEIVGPEIIDEPGYIVEPAIPELEPEDEISPETPYTPDLTVEPEIPESVPSEPGVEVAPVAPESAPESYAEPVTPSDITPVESEPEIVPDIIPGIEPAESEPDATPEVSPYTEPVEPEPQTTPDVILSIEPSEPEPNEIPIEFPDDESVKPEPDTVPGTQPESEDVELEPKNTSTIPTDESTITDTSVPKLIDDQIDLVNSVNEQLNQEFSDHLPEGVKQFDLDNVEFKPGTEFKEGEYGYYDPDTGTIVINQDTDGATETLIHEGIHMQSDNGDMVDDVGEIVHQGGIEVDHIDPETGEVSIENRPLNEGITEMLTRDCADDMGIAEITPAYVDGIEVAKALADTVGIEVVKEAYFQSDIDGLCTAVDSQLGEGALDEINTRLEFGDKNGALDIIHNGMPGD